MGFHTEHLRSAARFVNRGNTDKSLLCLEYGILYPQHEKFARLDNEYDMVYAQCAPTTSHASIPSALGSVMNFEKRQELQEQIRKWHARAKAALQQGERGLVRSAIREKRRYARLLAELPGDNPPHAALVPRQGLPGSGSGAIALELPEDRAEDE